MKCTRSLLVGCAGLILGACQGNPPAPSPNAPVVEQPRAQERVMPLIVKFRDTRNPADPAVLAQLSKAAGVTLVFRRAMSGGAFVLATATPLAVADKAALIARLRALPEVEWAEEDQMMKPMSRP